MFDDLDEEALLRILEILASNEFVITKKVYTINRSAALSTFLGCKHAIVFG